MISLVDIVLESSETATQAHHLGLTSVGWGYWADGTGKVVAKTEKGYLIRVKPGEYAAAKAKHSGEAPPAPALPKEKSPLISKVASFLNRFKKETEDVAVDEPWMFTRESVVPKELNGVPFRSWANAPKTIDEWKRIPNNPNIKEPELHSTLDKWKDEKGQFHSAYKKRSAGVIITEPDGRVWIIEPSNHHGGYEHTFPKGTEEPGLSLQQTAIKEAFEESGLKVELTGFLGDYKGDLSDTRYYTGKRVGGTPTDITWETNGVKLVPVKDLGRFFNRDRDKKIAGDIGGPKYEPPPAKVYEPSPKSHNIDWDKYPKTSRWSEPAGSQQKFNFDPVERSVFDTPPAPKKKKGFGSAFAKRIFGKKLSKGGGTSGGEFWKGEDGQVRFVKRYKDPTKAYGEKLANDIYEEMGISAPKSVAFTDQNDNGFFASNIMGGKELRDVQLTPEIAKDILQGFLGDVFLANYDVVGLMDDNIKITKNGRVHRIDQGGALLHRAMNSSGRKKEDTLDAIPEWDGLQDPTINKAYAKLWQISGLKPEDLFETMKEQMINLTAARKKAGGWKNYIEKHTPNMDESDQYRIAKMLIARERLLVQKLIAMNDERKRTNAMNNAAEKDKYDL